MNENFVFENCQVISKTINLDGETKRIEVALLGERIDDKRIDDLKAKMKKNSQLSDAELIVMQGGDNGLNAQEMERMSKDFKAGIIEDLYKKNEEALQSKDAQISMLENEVFSLRSSLVPVAEFKAEVKALNPNILEYSMAENAFVNFESQQIDTVLLAYAKFKSAPSWQEKNQLIDWVKARTKTDSVKLVVDVRL